VDDGLFGHVHADGVLPVGQETWRDVPCLMEG
jgi:hypothetical protein